MIDFLINLFNNNYYSLLILRLFIYLVLRRENKYQIAVYLWEQANSEKSIIEYILAALVGNKYTKYCSLKKLNSKHETSKLTNACLI